MNRVRLSDIGDIVTGKTPSTKEIDNFGGNIPFITPEDIFDGYIVSNAKRTITNKGFNSIKNNSLNGISVAVGCIGSDMGRVAIILGECATNQQINSITNIKENYNPFYVYYLLKNNTKLLKSLASGSTAVPLLSKSDFSSIAFDIPEKTYQSKVANVLSSLDSKIQNNNKINSELESMAKTLYDYWFLQFEFPNEEGKPYKSSGGKMVWNDELKREIPERWKVRKISNILKEADKSKVQVNEAKEKGGYPFFTSGNSILSYDEFFVDGFNIFLNTGGNPDIKAYMGKCAYSTDTWCISANEYSYVLYYYLLKLMPQFEQLFFAGSGLKHLQKNALKNKYILLPDPKLLKLFNVFCISNWKKSTNYYVQNQELSSLRDFLLPLLMNGQVTFKDESYE